jgi:hypothetical protein
LSLARICSSCRMERLPFTSRNRFTHRSIAEAACHRNSNAIHHVSRGPRPRSLRCLLRGCISKRRDKETERLSLLRSGV